MTEHHGWQVPAHFTSPEREAAQVREGVGLADLSWMARFELKGYEAKVPPALVQGVKSWTLAPRHLLLTCGPVARDRVIETLPVTPRRSFGFDPPCAGLLDGHAHQE